MSLLWRWAGARTLVWLLVVVFASGAALMVWFDADPSAHARRLGTVGPVVRSVHAAASLLLTLGVLAHALRRVTRSGAWRGARSGVASLLVVAAGSATGGLASQAWTAHRMGETLGWSDAATPALVVHIAYGSVLTLVVLHFHVARWGWSRLLRPEPSMVTAAAVSLAVGLAWPAAPPGSTAAWTGPTPWLVLPGGWGMAWPLAVAAVLLLWAWVPTRRRRSGRRA